MNRPVGLDRRRARFVVVPSGLYRRVGARVSHDVQCYLVSGSSGLVLLVLGL